MGQRVNKTDIVVDQDNKRTIQMLFPLSSVCASFVCFFPSGVISLVDTSQIDQVEEAA
jgi:hypothetical protein